jgi:hypothetical protein
VAVLHVSGRALGRARERLVGLVGGHDLRVVDGGDHGIGVEPRHLGERPAQVVVDVEQSRGRELQRLERVQRRLRQPGVDRARRHDRPAGSRRAGHAWLQLGPERHPEAAGEARPARGEALGRVPARDVALGALAEADRHQPPLDLVAEAPDQPGMGRPRRVRPRAARVREVSGDYRRH